MGAGSSPEASATIVASSAAASVSAATVVSRATGRVGVATDASRVQAENASTAHSANVELAVENPAWPQNGQRASVTRKCRAQDRHG